MFGLGSHLHRSGHLRPHEIPTSSYSEDLPSETLKFSDHRSEEEHTRGLFHRRSQISSPVDDSLNKGLLSHRNILSRHAGQHEQAKPGRKESPYTDPNGHVTAHLNEFTHLVHSSLTDPVLISVGTAPTGFKDSVEVSSL